MTSLMRRQIFCSSRSVSYVSIPIANWSDNHCQLWPHGCLGVFGGAAVLTRELKRREVPDGEELASSIITTAMVGGLIGSKRTSCYLRRPLILSGESFST